MRRIATWLATHSGGIVGISKGVLVAISIPIFTSQLEKAREATDLANIRSAYAEASAALLTGDTSTTNGVTYTAATSSAKAKASKQVTLGQTQADWQTSNDTEIGGKKLSDLTAQPTGTKGQVVYVVCNEDGTWDLTSSV